MDWKQSRLRLCMLASNSLPELLMPLIQPQLHYLDLCSMHMLDSRRRESSIILALCNIQEVPFMPSCLNVRHANNTTDSILTVCDDDFRTSSSPISLQPWIWVCRARNKQGQWCNATIDIFLASRESESFKLHVDAAILVI